MIKTDTYKLILDEKIRNDLTWQDLADMLHIKNAQNVIDAAHRGNLSDSYVKLAEALGCDIVISLVKRPHDITQFIWKVSPGRKYKGRGTSDMK